MSDYIKREDLLNALNAQRIEYNAAVNETIIKLPSADVVEVVRCKDCKHYRKDIPCVGGQYNGCAEWLDEGCEAPVEEDGYCSYGERADK